MKNKTLPFYFAVLVGIALPSKAAPPHIEAYGDSISAGFLSKTKVTAAPSLPEVSEIISNLAMFLMDRERNRDYVIKEHAPDLAWPAVFAKRYDRSGPIKLYNFAVSGARTWEMLGQVKGNKNTSGETRAFFFIGHNDLCNNLDSPANIGKEFSAEVEQALTQWEATHTDSTAYLIPVSDIHRVYKTLDGYTWYRGAKRNYTCADSWTKFFPYCPSHYKKYKAGTLDTYMVPRLAAMNQALDDLANQWSKRSRKNRYAYLKDAHDSPYEKDYFAIDCFHLSGDGQSAMASRLMQLVRQIEGP